MSSVGVSGHGSVAAVLRRSKNRLSTRPEFVAAGWPWPLQLTGEDVQPSGPIEFRPAYGRSIQDVGDEVGQIAVPDWVFAEFRQPPEKRNFDYSKMLFPDGRFVNHWRRGSSVPDICQLETKMWFYFLIGSYVNIGIEAIHVGQLDLMGRNDPEYRNWDDLLKRVRG